MSDWGCAIRPRSRGTSAGKGVVGFGEPRLRIAWVFAGQHRTAPPLQVVKGYARSGGGGIERPAEMLACVLETDPQPVMGEHVLIECGDDRKLDRKRWRTFAHTSLQIAGDLTRQPRPALRRTPNHDGIGAGGPQRRVGIVESPDVAVDDERNVDRIADRPHRIPIGAPGVELAARATMD